jgi:uncharacterized protein (DUF4415 family)
VFGHNSTVLRVTARLIFKCVAMAKHERKPGRGRNEQIYFVKQAVSIRLGDEIKWPLGYSASGEMGISYR